MDKICGIYKFTNKCNRKPYIGQSVDINRRRKSHINAAKRGDNQHFYRALRKYGIDNFDFDVLIECPKENLNYWEEFYIKYYCADSFGYNENKGGKHIHKEHLSDIHKERISNSNKGKPGHTAWNKGLSKELQPGYGKQHMLGRKLSDEWKTNIGKGVKGNHWKMSDEGRKHCSESHKGHIPWNKGIKTGKPAWNTGMTKDEMQKYKDSKLCGQEY